MTEAEWMASDDPVERLWFASGAARERKASLFRVACCHRVWEFILDARGRRAVDVVERWSDGGASEAELGEATYAAEGAHESPSPPYPDGPFHYAEAVACATVAARLAIDSIRGEPSEYTAEAAAHAAFIGRSEGASAASEAWAVAHNAERAVQHALLHDIFGNPFRPVAFGSSWRADTAVALARQMYESRDFGAMSILADALQDAGCDSADVLDHCRGPGSHVRGCWVVDLVLGKE